MRTASPAPRPPGTAGAERRWRAVECIALFGILPLLLPLVRHRLAFRTIPLVALLTLVCVFLLWRSPTFQRCDLRRWPPPPHLLGMLLLLALGAALLTGATLWHLEERFLALPRGRPFLWLLVMVLYPVLVGYPQELVFRAFFFDRYGALFRDERRLIAANGVSFGLYHLFYANWVAPVVATLGGLLFAYRYARTRSVPLVALEHGLWGDLLYTLGLGWYFYSGAIQ